MPLLTDKPAATVVSLSDLIHIVDVSDTTTNPLGSSKKASISQFLGALTEGDPIYLASEAANITDAGSGVVISTTERANIVTNNAKVTNATHTSEVTGSTALTLAPIAVSNKPLITATGTMELLVNDGGTLKKIVASDLLGGGSDGNGIYDGSGSLSGATTVTQGANGLRFVSTLNSGFTIENTSGHCFTVYRPSSTFTLSKLANTNSASAQTDAVWFNSSFDVATVGAEDSHFDIYTRTNGGMGVRLTINAVGIGFGSSASISDRDVSVNGSAYIGGDDVTLLNTNGNRIDIHRDLSTAGSSNLFHFSHLNSAASKKNFASIGSSSVDNTSTLEDGELSFWVTKNGSIPSFGSQDMMLDGDGLKIGTTTGTDRLTVNGTTYLQGNTRIDGTIRNDNTTVLSKTISTDFLPINVNGTIRYVALYD